MKDVYWGDLDYLVVDAPPGTSDEHISIVQYLQATQVDGAIIITTPQVLDVPLVRLVLRWVLPSPDWSSGLIPD